MFSILRKKKEKNEQGDYFTALDSVEMMCSGLSEVKLMLENELQEVYWNNGPEHRVEEIREALDKVMCLQDVNFVQILSSYNLRR